MKEKKLVSRKKKVFNTMDYMYNIFKEKKINPDYLLNEKKFLEILHFYKNFFIFNIYIEDFYFDFFLTRYNIIKNFWYFFLSLYNWKNEFLKIKIRKFFKTFLIKNSIKNIFITEQDNKQVEKSSFLFHEIKLESIFGQPHINKFFFLKKIRRKEVIIYNTFNKLFKHSINKKIKIILPSIFFNKYRKFKLITLIKYFIKFFKFKIKKEFIYFWERYYIYSLKRIYIYIEYILKKFVNYLYKQLQHLYLLLNLKKIKKNKFLFFLTYFFDIKKSNFLNQRKIYTDYKYVNKLLNLKIYKKNIFTLFLFNFNSIKINNRLFFLRKNLNVIKFFLKFKFFLNFKNFFFLKCLQFAIIWFNLLCFFRNQKKSNYVFSLSNYIIIPDKYIHKDDLKEPKWKPFSLIKNNYFFFNNVFRN